MQRVLSLWAPVAVWCGVIFALSSIPDLDLDSGLIYDYPLRKCAHMMEYAVLWFLGRRAAAGSGLPRPGVSAFALSVFYAATDEYHQTFVSGRHGAFSDVLIDAVGAALARVIASRSGPKGPTQTRLRKAL